MALPRCWAMLGFIGKAMIFTEQAALDPGRLQLAWLLTGYQEPIAQMFPRSILRGTSAFQSPSFAQLGICKPGIHEGPRLPRPRGDARVDEKEPQAAPAES